jgi:hypothetical protein
VLSAATGLPRARGSCDADLVVDRSLSEHDDEPPAARRRLRARRDPHDARPTVVGQGRERRDVRRVQPVVGRPARALSVDEHGRVAREVDAEQHGSVAAALRGEHPQARLRRATEREAPDFRSVGTPPTPQLSAERFS